MIERLSELLWGNAMLALILGVGGYFTLKSGFFQLRGFGKVLGATIFSAFKKKKPASEIRGKKEISQFQALSTALAASMGTGNIVGVATAITLGGAGAIFWMWVSSVLGMMTAFCENALGIYYRYKNSKGEWVGGPMVTLEKGLNARWLGLIYAALCCLAAFGMGNMTQANSIGAALFTSFSIPPAVTGVAVAAVVGIVILGGAKRIGAVTERLIPIISLAYIFAAILIIVLNYRAIPAAFGEIFRGAFGVSAIGGGVAGAAVRQAIGVGLRRGVFSNEAGLGSAVMVHAAADGTPAVMGMWAVFEVFIDTIVCCTLTALAILCTGVMGGGALDGAPLVIAAFESGFGRYAGMFVTISIVLFALATLFGWSLIGAKAAEYLLGERYVIYYKLIFILIILAGATMNLAQVWGISDILNGLMAIPNIICIILLRKQAVSFIPKPCLGSPKFSPPSGGAGTM